MRARFANTIGGPLQIILNCENEEERLLLQQFLNVQYTRKYYFCIHGFGGPFLDGASNMNFGWRSISANHPIKKWKRVVRKLKFWK